MDIAVFSKSELPVVYRALRTSLRVQGALSPRERTFLETYAKIVGEKAPVEDPDPIDAEAVFVEGAHQRKRLVQLAALAVLLNAPVHATSVAFLKALSQSLKAHDPVLGVIEALHRGRSRTVRMLTMRRGFRVMFKEAYGSEGYRGVARFVAALLFKAAVNKDKLWNYKRLGLLPEGTLGREYWKHMTNIGFGFPGEPAGIADSVAYHDIGHLLAGYDTTPLGEIQQGSFQGGNRREDGFVFIQFVILHFHHGLRITPAVPPEFGHFDPEKVLWAIHRGAMCNVDITHQWNYWPLMSRPLEVVRTQCSLLPKLDERFRNAWTRRMASERANLDGQFSASV
jgi:hypothetical protein